MDLHSVLASRALNRCGGIALCRARRLGEAGGGHLKRFMPLTLSPLHTPPTPHRHKHNTPITIATRSIDNASHPLTYGDWALGARHAWRECGDTDDNSRG